MATLNPRRVRRTAIGQHAHVKPSQTFAHSVVFDIGEWAVRVGVVGEDLPRRTVKTPMSFRAFRHPQRTPPSSRFAEAGAIDDLSWRISLEETIFRFLHRVMIEAGVFGERRGLAIVLYSSGDHPVVLKGICQYLSGVFKAVRLRSAAAMMAEAIGLQTSFVVDCGWSSTRATLIVGGVSAEHVAVRTPGGMGGICARLRADGTRQLEGTRLPPALLTDDLLERYVRRYGVVAPCRGQAKRDEVVAQRYPLCVKTAVLHLAPNRAIEAVLWEGVVPFERGGERAQRRSSASPISEDEAERRDCWSVVATLIRLLERCYEESCSHLLLCAASKNLILRGGCCTLPNFSCRVAQELLQWNIAGAVEGDAMGAAVRNILTGLRLHTWDASSEVVELPQCAIFSAMLTLAASQR